MDTEWKLFARMALVCGGRDYSDKAALYAALDQVAPAVIIHGGASGADAIADKYAKDRGLLVTVRFEAHWAKHGKAAGPIRNSIMLEIGKPHIVVACPGGRGTADMVKKARAAGVPVFEVGGSEDVLKDLFGGV